MDINSLNENKKKITIAGETVEVDATARVADTLKSILQSKGIDSFTILVDGDEIEDTNDLPATFAEADSIEVQRYVKPGM